MSSKSDITILNTGCPKKSGILNSSLNFENSIKQCNQCIFWFKSVFIQLSLDMLSIKFQRMSHVFSEVFKIEIASVLVTPHVHNLYSKWLSGFHINRKSNFIPFKHLPLTTWQLFHVHQNNYVQNVNKIQIFTN